MAPPTTNVYDLIDGKIAMFASSSTVRRPSKPWGWRSNGQEQVSRERALSANARHECLVMDASVSVKTAETAEMDDQQEREAMVARDCFRMGGSALPDAVRVLL
jgi:hypothetical protein